MSEFLDDLEKAMGIYRSARANIITENAVDGANEQAKSIKERLERGEISRLAAREELSQSAKELTLDLAVQGVPATTLQGIEKALSPDPLLSANDRFALAMEADQGSTEQLKLVTDARQQSRFENENSILKENRKIQHQFDLLDAKQKFQLQRDMKKAEEKRDKRFDKDFNSLSELNAQMDALGELEKNITLATGGFNLVPGVKQLSNFLFSDNAVAEQRRNTFFQKNLRKPLTGAQASPKEMVMLEKLMPTPTDRDAVAMAKMQELRDGVRKIRDRFIANLRARGANVDKYTKELARQEEELGLDGTTRKKVNVGGKKFTDPKNYIGKKPRGSR